MKYVYCSNCGLRLLVTRKALPKYSRIIDLIEPHKCLDEPVEFDLTPMDVPIPIAVPEGGNKFVQKLNELQPQPPTVEPGDRRDIADIKKETTSTAPRTLINNMKAMHNTTPVHDIGNGPKEE